MSLLAVEKLSDFSPLFFMKALQALVGGMFMQMYVCGFNQICDIELDKVNKPFLPLAGGELSMRTAIIVSSLSAIMSLSIARIVGSTALFWGFVGWFLVGTAYSANVLPLLRWKRFPLTAAFYMLMARALVVPIGYYMHMKNSLRGTSILLSGPTLFAVGMLSVFSIATIFFKDIPDIEGDQMHGIKSLASRIGQKRMFWSCICLLEMAYISATVVGATSTVTWSKYVTMPSDEDFFQHSVISYFLIAPPTFISCFHVSFLSYGRCRTLGNRKPDGLGAELLETLVKMAPMKEEGIKLRDYRGDISKLGSA